MSSILNALKKLEDETAGQGGQNSALPGSPDTKQVIRNGVQKRRGYSKILFACFSITAVLGILVWFIATRNPAAVPEQTSPQSESGTAKDSGAPPAPESHSPVSERKTPAKPVEKKAQVTEKQGGVPVSKPAPVHSSSADAQKNLAKIQIPDERKEPPSAVAEKNDGKGKSEAVKNAPAAPLLPGPKNPVKPEVLLPASKNPVKTETPGPEPQTSAVSLMKKMQPLETVTQSNLPDPVTAQSEQAKASAPSEPVSVLPSQPETVKSSAKPEPVKTPSQSEAVTSSAKPEPVKTPAQPEAVKSSASPEPVKSPAQPESEKTASKPSEPVKTPSPPEAVKSSAKPDPAKTPSLPEAVKSSAKPEPVKKNAQPEPVKSPGPSEPVKTSVPSQQESYASVGEKTAGETGLSIQALVWSEEPAERMAVINGSIVREKGIVSDVSILHIGSNYIIFQNNSGKWMQKFRLN